MKGIGVEPGEFIYGKDYMELALLTSANYDSRYIIYNNLTNLVEGYTKITVDLDVMSWTSSNLSVMPKFVFRC